MIQSEVVSKLSHECCLAMGDFDHFQTVSIYIQMALVVGTEHFRYDMEEVVAFYQDGIEAGRFKNIVEASNKLGIHRQNIQEVVSGRRHSAGGLTFIKLKDHELVGREATDNKRCVLFCH